MTFPRSGLLALLLVAAVLPTGLTAQLLIVDANGGLNRYKTIQSAVDAASDGSTLLVMPGHYAEAVTIRAKALVILGGGSQASEVIVSGISQWAVPLRILDHPRGRQTRVARLTLESGALLPSYVGLEILGGGGSIALDWVAMVDPLRQWPPRLTASSFLGMLVLQGCRTGDVVLTDVASTVLQQCVVAGSGFWLNSWSSAPGLRAERSHVEVCRSSIQATPGLPMFYRTSTSGGAGIELANATLLLRGLPSDVIAGGDEHGLYPNGAGSALSLYRSTAVYSGVTLRSGNAKNPPPPVVFDPKSSAFPVVPPAPTLERSDVFRYGRTTNLVIHGRPGDLGIVLVAQRLGLAAFPFGNLHLDLASVLLPMAAVLDAGGQAVMPLSLASIDPAYVGSMLLAQAVVLDRRSNPTLTGVVASVVLW